jgi:hypothetical protein
VPDATGIGTNTANVRAARSPTGNGRVYEITFSASDGKESSTGRVKVKVNNQKRPAVDSGQIYDATRSR